MTSLPAADGPAPEPALPLVARTVALEPSAAEALLALIPALPPSAPHVAAPGAAGSRARIPSVDDTLDDAEMEPPYASPSQPLPTRTSAAAIPPPPWPVDAAVLQRRTDAASTASAP